ncbi:MAG: hypothetical protein QXT81_04975 [Candidatus Bathyarchaeia archaeon]
MSQIIKGSADHKYMSGKDRWSPSIFIWLDTLEVGCYTLELQGLESKL